MPRPYIVNFIKIVSLFLQIAIGLALNIIDTTGLVNRFFRLFLLIGVWSVAFVVIATVGLIVTLPWLVQSKWAIDKISSVAGGLSGTSIVIEGPISLTLGKAVRVSVHNVAVRASEAPESPVIFSLKDGEVEIPVYENILSAYTFNNLLVEDVFVVLGAQGGGKTNEPTHPNTAESGAGIGEESDKLPQIVVPVFKNARVRALSIVDESATPPRRFVVNELTVTSPSQEGGISLDGALSINDDQYQLRGSGGDVNVLLNGATMPIRVAVESPRHSLELVGSIATSGQLDLKVSAKGDDFSTFGAPFIDGLPSWKPYRVQSNVVWPGKGAMRFSDVSAELSGIKIEGAIEGSLNKTGGVIGTAALSLPQFGITANGEMISTKEYVVKVKGGLSDLRVLNPLFVTELPQIESLFLDGSAHYTVSSKGSAIRLDKTHVKIGASEAEVEGAIALDPLKIQGNVAAKVIDVPSLQRSFGGEREGSSEGASGHTKVHAHEQQVPKKPAHEVSPFSFLDGLDIEAQVKVDALKGVVPEDISALTTDLTIRDGSLRAPKISGVFAGGAFEAAVEASTESIAVKGDSKGVKCVQLFNALSTTPFVEGEFDISVDVRASSRSVSDTAKTLSGEFSISSDHATFKSKALELSASSLQRILAPIFSRGEQAESDCLILDYAISEGRITPKGNVINLGDVFIFARGEADIPADKVSMSFNVNSTNPSLASLIPPFRAVGSLSSPFFIPSTSGSVASVFDTAEGIFDSAVGMVGDTARFILSRPGEVLVGKAQCQRALEEERKRFSSRVGRAISSEK